MTLEERAEILVATLEDDIGLSDDATEAFVLAALRQVRAVALEEAAVVCEEWASSAEHFARVGGDAAYEQAVDNCAAAIRALAGREGGAPDCSCESGPPKPGDAHDGWCAVEREKRGIERMPDWQRRGAVDAGLLSSDEMLEARLERVGRRVSDLFKERVYENGEKSQGIAVRFLMRMHLLGAEVGLVRDDNPMLVEARAHFDGESDSGLTALEDPRP